MVPGGSKARSTHRSHRASLCLRLPLHPSIRAGDCLDARSARLAMRFVASERAMEILAVNSSRHRARMAASSIAVAPPCAIYGVIGGRRRPTTRLVHRSSAAVARVQGSPTCGSPGTLQVRREHRDGNLRTPCAIPFTIAFRRPGFARHPLGRFRHAVTK